MATLTQITSHRITTNLRFQMSLYDELSVVVKDYVVELAKQFVPKKRS